jgi:hypothetical protein
VKAGASVPRPPSIDSNEDHETDFDDQRDDMDHDVLAGKFLTAQSGPIAQFSSGMPDWMNMTPEVISLAVESLPNPSEGHILPGIWPWRYMEVHECLIMSIVYMMPCI